MTDVFIVIVTIICFFEVTKGMLYVESIKNCEENPDFDYNITSNFTSRKGIQYIDSDMTLRKPLGNEIMVQVTLFTTPDRVKYLPLFKFKDKLCVCIKKHFGQLGYDFLMNAHIRPGSCPFPKGNYHVRNFPLDFSKMPFATFPGGKMRFQTDWREIDTGKLIGCVFIDSRME